MRHCLRSNKSLLVRWFLSPNGSPNMRKLKDDERTVIISIVAVVFKNPVAPALNSDGQAISSYEMYMYQL